MHTVPDSRRHVGAAALHRVRRLSRVWHEISAIKRALGLLHSLACLSRRDVETPCERVPREIGLHILRGVFNHEARELPCVAVSDDRAVPPHKVIAWLVGAGILHETPLRDAVQFAHDPVAEILAARWLSKSPNSQLTEKLLESATPLGELLRVQQPDLARAVEA